MSIAALVVAAGRGRRFGSDRPKQWHDLAGSPLIRHTLETFRTHPRIGRIVVVLHPDDRADTDLRDLFDGCLLADGGDTRAASVRNGLMALKETGTRTVLIHDAARPCVSHRLIGRVIDEMETARAAAPALPVTDALWTGEDGKVTGIRDRRGIFRAQTPQGFDFQTILAAHDAHPGDAADDVEVARAHGIEVAMVPGEEDNLKVTVPDDLIRAERILRGKMDIRLGNGFDVHRFGPGNGVILCGVRIDHDRALQGHSDADVGLHAITDALYGALARGDIGQHFPPSDPQWKGADSAVFLEHAVSLTGDAGFAISNIDCTLICEQPKIGPHAPAMRSRVAGLAGIPQDRVSVKATTSEQLGFTGRGEGIAAMATATLVKS